MTEYNRYAKGINFLIDLDQIIEDVCDNKQEFIEITDMGIIEYFKILPENLKTDYVLSFNERMCKIDDFHNDDLIGDINIVDDAINFLDWLNDNLSKNRGKFLMDILGKQIAAQLIYKLDMIKNMKTRTPFPLMAFGATGISDQYKLIKRYTDSNTQSNTTTAIE